MSEQNKNETQPTDTPQGLPEPSSSKDKQTATASGKDPVRRLTRIVLIVCAVMLFWYVVADRLTPSTGLARVKGYVVPMAPQVSGRVEEVLVGQNEFVVEDQPLLKIDPTTYEIALHKAEADLERAGQEVGAGTAEVAAAQARLADAQAMLKSIQADASRIFAVEHKGVIPKADIDRARARLEQARAQVNNAKAALQKAKEQLGSAGAENPRIKAALSALQKARRDLANTTLRAPSDGGITNVRVDSGYYAQPGKPLMTFVSTKDVWVEAYLRENSLGRVAPGNPVDLVLDIAPGRVFKGEVASIGFGAKWEQGNSTGELSSTPAAQGWLRDPQRFAVIIKFTDEQARGLRRAGGQADVVIYTGGNIVFNALAWLRIRLVSVFSYLY